MADLSLKNVIFVLILFVLITDNCENVNNDEPNCHFGRRRTVKQLKLSHLYVCMLIAHGQTNILVPFSATL